MSSSYGAHASSPQSPRPADPDYTDAPPPRTLIAMVGSTGALNTALRATEPEGTCVVNSIFFQDDLPLPMLSMYTHGVRLVTGRVNARPILPKALDLVVQGAFHPETITDAVVPWRDAADALTAEPQKLVICR